MDDTKTSRFDLNTYITDNYYTVDLDSNNMDIFDELELPSNMSRRFSFSIPEDCPFIIPPPPPPSPNLSSIPRLSIHIPEDTVNDSDAELDSFELEPPTPKNIQSSLYKESLLIYSSLNRQIYKRPPKKASDARKIWRYAKIPSVATIYEIECKLLDWAFTYAYLEIIDNKIKTIVWRTNSDCRCKSSWSTFLRWMICACNAI